MKNRILTLGLVLALIAAIIVPAAVVADTTGTAEVTGSIVEAELNVTAPSAIAFGNFVFGDNILQSATNGTVGIIAGSRNASAVAWQVVAYEDGGDGYMSDNGNLLTNELEISMDGSTWELADPGAGLNYTGTGAGTLEFWAKQTIAGDETPGDYAINITFTGSLTA
jgi:hypothetical protein